MCDRLQNRNPPPGVVGADCVIGYTIATQHPSGGGYLFRNRFLKLVADSGDDSLAGLVVQLLIGGAGCGFGELGVIRGAISG